MKRSKTKVHGKRLLSVMLAALTIGSTVVTTGSLTGVGISASAVSDTAATSASYFEYYDNDDGTVTITGYNGSDTELVIPSEIDGKKVTSIGVNAFRNCTGFTSVTIPDSVTEIGEAAFYGCTGLTGIIIPDSVTKIYYSAFEGCAGITSLSIGKGVISICNSAFYGCTGLTSVTIPDSVTEIGNYAFYRCTGLTNITIPDSVKYIGEHTFSYCTGLKNVTILDGVTSIGWFAFYGCTGLTSVTIPDSVTSIDRGAFDNTAWYDNQSDGVVYAGKVAYSYKGEISENTTIVLKNDTKVIHQDAFRGCAGLTNIIIPDSVTKIDYSALDNTAWYNNQPDGLVYAGKVAYTYKGEMPENTNITLKNGTKGIADNAFCRCKGLTSVTISDSVISIGNNAFRNCTGLTSVAIPDSVTEIGHSAFADCTGLTGVTIGNNVIKIGYYAFRNCTALTSIKVDENNKCYSSQDGVMFNKDKTELIMYPVGKAGAYTIPDSVTEIGTAFVNCKGLTSLTIPDSVISIVDYAFQHCTGLTSITIPESVTSIGESAFDDTAWYNNQPDGLVYAGKVAYKYKGEMPENTNITLKNGTKGIADYAFFRCTGLTSVTIPDSVTEIGSYAFYCCTGLTDVTIPNNVTSIGYSTFSDCTGLKNITIGKNVKAISSKAFSGCTGLTSITIPDSVTGIGGGGTYEGAFEGCTGLTSVTIPDSVTEIGSYAFYYCTRLTSVTIPDSVIKIGDYAFGYYEDKWSDYINKLIDDFKIYGVKGSAAETYANKHKIPFVETIFNNSTISAKTITKGNSVTLTGKATGGTEPYTYAYYYKKTTDKSWKIAKDYSNTTSVSIKPAYATTYDVCIKVKDAKGTVVKKYFTVSVKNAALANKSTISKTTITKGNSITLTGKATGGTSPYKYAYYYKKASSTSWTTAKDWSSTTSVSIKPAYATTYDVCIKVKDAKGTVAKKYFTVNVTAPLANNSTISKTTITKGNSITLTGKATGGTAPYTYAYCYKKTSSKTWTTAKTWSSSTSVSIKPAYATTYDVCIKVKDSKGTVAKKYFTLTVK